MPARTTTFASLWAIVVLFVLIAMCLKAWQGLKVENNIFALLPAAKADDIVEKATQVINTTVGAKVIFLVGAPERSAARDSARLLYDKLNASTLFSEINFEIDEAQQQSLFQTYYQYRRFLLTASDRNALKNTQLDSLTQAATAQLYNPVSLFGTALLGEDPLFVFQHFMESLSQSQESMGFDEGLLSTQHDDTHYVLLITTLRDNAFSLGLQEEFSQLYQGIKQDLAAQHSSTQLLSMGAIHHAMAAASSAKWEISVIGVGSLIGIIVLIATTFRSAIPFLLSLLPLAVGILCGCTACFWVFGSMHLMTFVFGVSLIGVSIDYSFHFLSEQRGGGSHWQATDGLKRILPGITLGLLTSLIGYAGLLVAPFPGLQQISLFSSVGLLAAYLSVVCWYPLLLQAQKEQPQPLTARLAIALVNGWDRHISRRALAITFVIALTAVVFGALNIRSNDDVRILHASPSAVIQEENRVRDIMGSQLVNQFYLIRGDSPEDVLQREERLTTQLDQLQATESLTSYKAVTNWIPSRAVQQENFGLLRKHILDEQSALNEFFRQTGYDEQVVLRYRSGFVSTNDSDYLSLQNWMSSPAAANSAFMWLGKINASYASIVVLGQFTDMPGLAAVAQKIEGVDFVDPVGKINETLSHYRVLATKLVVAAYLVIFVLLLARYGPLKGTLVIMPPLLAAGIAIAASAWLAIPLNLFNTLALILVLGIGIDYTLFFAEHRNYLPKERYNTMLAVLLSALTTVLSFGLLALSETPVIQSFGLMVWVGISVAFIGAPIVGAPAFTKRERKREGIVQNAE